MNHPLEPSIMKMIKEAFEGPPVPVKESWFTNTEANSGVFGALDGISAGEASISVYGTTLAAHVDHVRYHMWGTNRLLKTGEVPKMEWGDSWKIDSMNDQQWRSIQEGLRNEYSTLVNLLGNLEWNELLANEVTGSLAHSAYHLGAIRQILKAVKDN